MTKKIIMGIALASTFLFMGCGGGGGGGSTPPVPVVDNSVLADGQNAYGYYGENVIFGNSRTSGAWTTEAKIDGEDYHATLILDSDGRYFRTGTGNNEDGYYGISLDGQSLQNSGGDYATITQSLENECYLLTVHNGDKTVENAKFCRTYSSETSHVILIMHNVSKDTCESDSFYDNMAKNGVLNLKINSYSNDIDCAEFDTSESYCSESYSGGSNETSCVIEYDL